MHHVLCVCFLGGVIIVHAPCFVCVFSWGGDYSTCIMFCVCVFLGGG